MDNNIVIREIVNGRRGKEVSPDNIKGVEIRMSRRLIISNTSQEATLIINKEKLVFPGETVFIRPGNSFSMGGRTFIISRRDRPRGSDCSRLPKRSVPYHNRIPSGNRHRGHHRKS